MKKSNDLGPGVYHFIQTQGHGDVSQEAIMSREKADQANEVLAYNTDYYWAEKHPAGFCFTCTIPEAKQ